MEDFKTLAFEIGTEEIPAFDLANATKQLEDLVPKVFEEARIGFDEVEIFSTPRRLIAIVHGVAAKTEALIEEHKGPSLAIALDESGEPTKAAIGFAKGKGIEVADLERRVVGDTEYVFAVRKIASQQVEDLLPAILGSLIESITWPKSCRWGTQTVYFSRPVRWLLALFGDRTIPVRFADLVAGNTTQGHRFLAPGSHEVSCADDLIPLLERSFVVPSQARREEVIRAGIAEIESQTGSVAELPEKTLLEVINLTEYPTPLVGSFEESYLEVPEEIIVDAMLMHQRYFPLYDADRKLTNQFIAVSNGNPEYSDIIIDGNERVVRPRLSDAKFFYEEDLKHPLEFYVDRLDEVVFQESLGTMKAKTDRIVVLARELALAASLDIDDIADTARAAYLSKADLVSNAVVEFTSVQGIMGSYYALASGENEQVAQAIADHYRPRFAGDEAPVSTVGKLVAVADKLDTICGLFAVGQGPTGSSDPFALRRSAIGIVNMLGAGLEIELIPAIDVSLGTYGALSFENQKVKDEIVDFFVTRTKVMLRDGGQSADVIDAVLASGIFEPAEIIARVEALAAARRDMPEAMDDLATAYARANNLRDAALGASVDESLMGVAEQALYAAIQKVDADVSSYLSENNYVQALRSLAALRAPIDVFFEEVLIMDKDDAIKNNRLRLLNRFVSTFSHVADFGKMAKSSK